MSSYGSSSWERKAIGRFVEQGKSFYNATSLCKLLSAVKGYIDLRLLLTFIAKAEDIISNTDKLLSVICRN